jgi:hypothetical protein|tara:strand:- start:468 stop:947 length:480 start_codon:yes stop_codon:yes gene_type:complete
MAYIRPCNKCSQRISMREMRAGQWVAFDASTDKPHKCGKKNKEDPNIKELAKQKNKEQESDNIDLGYESEIDKDIEILEERLENIKEKQETEIQKEKVKRKKNIDFNIKEKIDYSEEAIASRKKEETKTIGWYVWRLMLAVWAFGIINWLLGCPFASCN